MPLTQAKNTRARHLARQLQVSAPVSEQGAAEARQRRTAEGPCLSAWPGGLLLGWDQPDIPPEDKIGQGKGCSLSGVKGHHTRIIRWT